MDEQAAHDLDEGGPGCGGGGTTGVNRRDAPPGLGRTTHRCPMPTGHTEPIAGFCEWIDAHEALVDPGCSGVGRRAPVRAVHEPHDHPFPDQKHVSLNGRILIVPANETAHPKAK